MNNKEKIVNLLIRLKKVSHVYQIANEEQRGKLLNACQGIFDELDSLTGEPKIFWETLVIGGKDFLESLYKADKDIVSGYDAEIIFS